MKKAAQKKNSQKKNMTKAASKAMNKKNNKRATRRKASADKISRQKKTAQQTLATMAASSAQETSVSSAAQADQKTSPPSSSKKAQQKADTRAAQASAAKHREPDESSLKSESCAPLPKQSKAQQKNITKTSSNVSADSSLHAASEESAKNVSKSPPALSKKSKPQGRENIMAGNRRAFYYYIAIFLCLLLLEAHRFSLYLEDKSADYPEFTYISEALTYLGESTGLNTLMGKIGSFTADLSEEQIIEPQTSWQEQWQAAWNYYKGVLGFSLEGKVAEQKKQPDSKPLDETKKQDGKEQKKDDDTKIADKDIKKPETEKQKEHDKESQKAEKTPSKQPRPAVHYAFYDPNHIRTAPTEFALDEYATKLPDFGKKVKVLLVGDSMMQGLVPLIQTSLKHRKDIEIAHRAKVSTGLSNQTFFNWPENLKKLLKQHDPQVTIVFMGANDPQHLKVNKKWFGVDTEGWRKIYSLRTLNFLELATANNRKVVWIGLPMMLKEPYAKRIKVINKVYKDVNAFYSGAAFVDTEMLLTDKGKYISFITGKNNKTIRLRQKDNIHLTFAGGRMITEHMIPTFDAKVQAVRLDEVKGNPLIPVAGKANTITFTSNIQEKNVEYTAYLPAPLSKEEWEKRKEQEKQQKQLAKQNPSTEAMPAVGDAQAALPKAASLWDALSEGLQSPTAQTQEESVPVGIVAVQKDAKAPSSVSKLIAQSLQTMPQVLPLENNAITLEEKENKKSAEKAAQEAMAFTDEKFPVLYLLHGATSNGRDWNMHMGKELQKIANEKRVIIVAPTTGEYNWYVNSPVKKSSQMENFILKELVPHVDMLFPTTTQRAIAGLSMGGHGAMLLGLKHPKTFQSVASASGVLDIRLHPDSWNISKVLGPYTKNKLAWDNNSVAHILTKKTTKNLPKQILITTGLQDTFVLEDNKKVYELIQKKKFHCEYEELEGNHDWKFWSEQFSKLLRKQADFIKIKQS